MDLDAGALIASLLVSSVGFALFVYGKRQERAPQLLSGIVMMVFPYFTGGAVSTLGVAVAVILSLWLSVRAGL